MALTPDNDKKKPLGPFHSSGHPEVLASPSSPKWETRLLESARHAFSLHFAVAACGVAIGQDEGYKRFLRRTAYGLLLDTPYCALFPILLKDLSRVADSKDPADPRSYKLKNGLLLTNEARKHLSPVVFSTVGTALSHLGLTEGPGNVAALGQDILEMTKDVVRQMLRSVRAIYDAGIQQGKVNGEATQKAIKEMRQTCIRDFCGQLEGNPEFLYYIKGPDGEPVGKPKPKHPVVPAFN